MKRRIALMTLFLAFLHCPARAASVGESLRLADSGQWNTALSQLADSGDETASDLVRWYYLTDAKTDASFDELARFAMFHRDWPRVNRLMEAAEKKMPDTLAARQVSAFFGEGLPQTAAGMTRYLNAKFETHETEAALAALKKWWVDADLTAEEQSDILSRFKKYFSTADHQRRLETLFKQNQYTQARGLAAAMGGGWPQLVEIRVALDSGKGEGIRFDSLPKALLSDPGLMRARVTALRKQNHDDEAMTLLLSVGETTQSGDPKAWGLERSILIRRMIEQRRYREAYALASDHKLPKDSQEFSNAEFVAGWLALRFLRQPETAFKHFETLFDAVKMPQSRSRGAYWAGRAAESDGKRDIALQWYQLAARYQTTWYGQQAAQRINAPATGLDDLEPKVSRDQKNMFESRSLVRAVRLLAQAGLQRQQSAFFKALVDNATSPQDYKLATELALELGQNDATVKIAKKAEKDSVFLTRYAYPVLDDAQRQDNADPALVHAIIRQESQFDQYAQSPVGALGLMQLMPATAAETARKAGVEHETSWLVEKPSHNVALGSLYIQKLINRYDGTEALAVAAYNAGQGRVDGWLRQFGDPRDPKVDLIDWIELIPVQETRNYVQRVLEGRAVYEKRLQAGRIANSTTN